MPWIVFCGELGPEYHVARILWLLVRTVYISPERERAPASISYDYCIVNLSVDGRTSHRIFTQAAEPSGWPRPGGSRRGGGAGPPSSASKHDRAIRKTIVQVLPEISIEIGALLPTRSAPKTHHRFSSQALPQRHVHVAQTRAPLLKGCGKFLKHRHGNPAPGEGKGRGQACEGTSHDRDLHVWVRSATMVAVSRSTASV